MFKTTRTTKLIVFGIVICMSTFSVGILVGRSLTRQLLEATNEPVEISNHEEAWQAQPPPVELPSDFHQLVAIQVIRYDPENEITESRFENWSARDFNVDLELSESIENQVISLLPFQGDRREFKLEQQFETSMAISDEGPHWDFTDWKHFTSDWTEIKRLDNNRFLTSKIPESMTTKFPKVTQKEIYRRVAKEANGRWKDLARECKGSNEAPCYVGVSRVSFRVSAKGDDRWTVLHQINFSIPLGC